MSKVERKEVALDSSQATSAQAATSIAFEAVADNQDSDGRAQVSAAYALCMWLHVEVAHAPKNMCGVKTLHSKQLLASGDLELCLHSGVYPEMMPLLLVCGVFVRRVVAVA